MPSPRSSLVNVETTPYYHCVSRCVRRAFLCGVDFTTQKDYEHRRQWVEDRILELAEVFSVDVCAYAVMSNHLHVVLHLNPNQAAQWTDLEVVQRWHLLFSGKPISRLYASGVRLSSAQQSILNDLVTCWRERLSNLSWFMRCLNEPIARKANIEDGCTGHFWESRFKSQALADEQALIAAMAYVDLNPVRAGIADTPETSEHTSVKTRIGAVEASSTKNLSSPPLFPFVGDSRERMSEGIPFCFKDYLSLLDWTGRSIHPNKKGFIANDQPPILNRLAIRSDAWMALSRHFEQSFQAFVGTPSSLKRVKNHLGKQKIRGSLTNAFDP